jgi:MYXO-CTERM domain-containing protein
MSMKLASRLLVSLAAAGAVCLVQGSSSAHFRLDAPPADHAQNAQGDPQKAEPCGGGTTPTGMVTAVQSGQTITINLEETIFHPGHYRVAIAQDPSQLPAVPDVTPGATDCGSVEIVDPPALPILADGMLLHDAPFSGAQSFDVTLPEDFTCDNCTLQVVQFMSNHGAPCFYYHCATVTVQSEPVMTTSATTGAGATTAASGTTGSGNGATTTVGAGSGGGDGVDWVPEEEDDGCGCRAAGTPVEGMASLALLGLGAIALARRSRKR